MSPSSSVILSASVGAPTHLDLRVSAQFTIGRHITTLFKECLMIVEQLAEEHDEAMEKLYDALPPDYQPYVELANHFTEDKYARIRSAILQRGNDAKRAVADELEMYDLTFHAPSIPPRNPPSL